MPFDPDLVESGAGGQLRSTVPVAGVPAAPPLLFRGHLLRPINAGPCGDVRIWDDRELGNDAIWCGVVIVDALLTIGARLEVL